MTRTTSKDVNGLLFWLLLSVIFLVMPGLGYLLRHVNIISPYLSILFAVVAVTCVIMAWKLRHRYIKLTILVLLCLAMAVLSIGAGINAYAGYFPSIAFLLGEKATDEIPQNLTAQVLSPDATAAFLNSVHSSGQGGVLQVAIPSTKSGFKTNDALVYLPPAWFVQPHPSLPVAIMLGGAPGFSKDWTQAGHLDITADAWARRHNGIAPIFVMTDYTGGFKSFKTLKGNDSECVNGKYGNVETYLTEDVPAWISKTFNTESQPSHWAIGGFSLGGYCAMTLSLRHQSLYGVYLDISGESKIIEASGLSVLLKPGTNVKQIVNGHNDFLLLKHPGRTVGCYISGSDENLSNLQKFRAEAAIYRAALGTSVLIGSRHTWSYAEVAFEKAFPWLAGELHAGTNQIPNQCLQS